MWRLIDAATVYIFTAMPGHLVSGTSAQAPVLKETGFSPSESAAKSRGL
jgi:hypothetical protein